MKEIVVAAPQQSSLPVVRIASGVAVSGGAALIFLGWHWLGLISILGGLVIAGISKLVRGIEQSAQTLQPSDSDRELKQGLFKAQYTPGTESLAEQAVEQLRQITDRSRDFRKLLNDRLSPTELTYGRFLAAAEEVQATVIARLGEILTEFRSLESSDATYAEGRIKTATDPEEVKALKERLELRDVRFIKIHELLSGNEKALTQYDRTLAAVSAMQTGSKAGASTDLATALEGLEEIARRAKSFQKVE